jgi:hypothetical protein
MRDALVGGVELAGPGPLGGQAQPEARGGPCEAGGDVQEPVTEGAGLGPGKLAVQAQLAGAR